MWPDGANLEITGGGTTMRYEVTAERTLLFEMSTGGRTTVPIEVDLAYYEWDPPQRDR